MKHLVIILITLCCFIDVQGQRLQAGASAGIKITRNYDNVSMSEALRDLNELSPDYTISFMYNELEDFRVTTSIKHQSVPDALRQIIGFYPVRVVKRGAHELYAYCIHKTDRHLTGTIIDEQGQPVAYANVCLLHPSDSTLIGGGVSNEAGLFVIPYDTPPQIGNGREGAVLVRISYVGYKTIYRYCHSTQLGTIRMQPVSYKLNGVEVKGSRPLVRIKDDAFVTTVEGSYLSKMGTGYDVLTHIPGVLRSGSSIEVVGRGAPLVYINGRLMRDQGELNQLSSDQIKDVEVVMTPGAKYDASVRSVVRIKTVRPVGEGFSFDNKTLIGINHYVFGQEEVNVNYRAGGLDLFATADIEDFRMKVKNTSRQDTRLPNPNDNPNDNANDNTQLLTPNSQLLTHNTHFVQQSTTHYTPHTNIYYGKLGFNYMFSDHHAIGMTYTVASRPSRQRSNFMADMFENETNDDHLTGDGHETTKRIEHRVNAYYSGSVGKWSIDVNADMVTQNETTEAFTQEIAKESESRNVTTRSEAKNRLYAAKLVTGQPLWKGKLEMGAEGSHVRRTDAFANPENIIMSSHTETQESNGAVFAELTQQLGKLTAKLGFRFEHVASRYFSATRSDTTRTYNDIFPSAMLSYPIGKVQARLSYARNINRPAFSQLTSDLSYINRYLYESGNPYLRPTYRDNLSLAINWKWMMAMIDYAHVHDYIINSYSSYNGDPTIALLQKNNTNGFNNLQAMLHFSPTFGWYHPQLMLALMWQDLEVSYLGKTKRMTEPMRIVRFNNAVNLPKDIWLNADLSWRSAGDSENIGMAPSWQFDLSLYKAFFHDRLSVKLACSDIFASMRQKITIFSDIRQFRLDKRTDNRSLKLTLRYAFNPVRSKYKGTGAGNTEKNRL